MKVKVLIVSLLIVLSFSVLAEPADVDAAYKWLLERSNTDVYGASLTALAISRADTSSTQPYIDYIKGRKHPTQACWPNPNCNVKDTVGALLVETKLGGTDTASDDIVDWLASRQGLAPLSGNWNLQIITADTGQCALRYQRLGEALSNEFTLNVDKGKISYGSCQDQYFFNLNSCLGANILNKPSTVVEVSCSSLGSSSISVVYLEGNSIYLIGTPISSRARITVNNGFFGNRLDTLYANWALKEANSDINSLIYLKKNQVNTVLDQSLLFLSTREESYLNNLILLRSGFGQFVDQGGSANEFGNGLAGLVLQINGQHASELESLRDWLGSKQKLDGSWSSNDKTTAMILYGAYQGGNLPTGDFCGNGVIDFGETCSSCPEDVTCADEVPECSDGIDNDNDGLIDLDDPDCTSELDNSESFIVTSECALLNPRWLSQSGVVITTARGSQIGRAPGDTVLVSVEGNSGCGGKQISFDVFEDELGEDPSIETLGPISFNVQEGFVFMTWKPIWFDDNPLPEVDGDPEFYFIAKTTGVVSRNSSLLQVTKPSTTECSDGIDNDGNGLCDTLDGICSDGNVTEGDPGCRDLNDLVENVNALACADGIDNDNDGLIDTQDPGCSAPFDKDNSEVDGVCIPDFSCDPWSPCSIGGTQTRICRDLNACGEECAEDDETCVTERECPTGEEDDIDIPDTGVDTGEEDEPSVLANPCSVNDICEPEWGEDEFNCAEDCKPLDEPEIIDRDTDFGGEDDFVDEFEEEDEGSSSFWLITILVLLMLILVGTYFFVFKKPAPKVKREFGLPSQPSRPPLFGPKEVERRPISIPKIAKKSKVEDELEKSLREAKRLLGK